MVCSGGNIWGLFLFLTLLPVGVLPSPSESPTPLVGSITQVIEYTNTNCPFGLGQLNLTIVNIAENNIVYKSSSNLVTMSNESSGNPNAFAGDSGGSNPKGVYLFPCVPAGIYRLTATKVSGNATTGDHYACGVLVGCNLAVPPGGASYGGFVMATWNVIPNGYGATPQTNTTNPTPTKIANSGETGLVQMLGSPLVLTVIGAWLALVATAGIIVTRRKRQEVPTTA